VQVLDAIDPANQGLRTERGPATLLPDPVPAELWCPLISVDDHALEPANLFENRVSKRFRDEAPRLIDDDHGLPHWCFDDLRLPVGFGNGAAGRPVDEWTLAPQRIEEFRQGVGNIHFRVKDMDLNGVYSSLCFPSVIFGFSGKRFQHMRNKELGLECVRAYNDWMLEEWCGAYPDRFIPCQLAWMADPEVAARDIIANHERGFLSVSFAENPEGLDFPHIYGGYWDPFFRACEETGTVINLHVGSSGKVARPSSCSPGDTSSVLFPINGLETVVDWIYAKIPGRFPNLKIVLSEAGVSWVPMIIERLGRVYQRRDMFTTWSDQDLSPVEMLRRNFWFTSIDDPSAFRLLDIIGANKVMAEADYPHSDSSWPETQELMRHQLQHLDVETIKQICYRTASELYRHPEPPSSLVASSIVGRSPSQVD
jgi:predicted TIM-barrel fold metal-dependent hydrolase